MSADLSVEQRLFSEPWRFEFFQAVRLLERLFTDRAPTGRHEHPRQEIARFRSHISLVFPASEIFALQPGKTDAAGAVSPAEVTVNFMGLAGPLGALPTHYAAMLADPGLRTRSAAFREFLDLFNHRLISLFYRAWEKYRPAIAFERGDEDRFSFYLFCLVGMGTPGSRGRMKVDDHALLFYSGLLAQRPHAAVSLEGILRDYFGVPVHVRQFEGQWFPANPETLTRIGVTNGQNNRLGVDSILWEHVWDPQARFRVRLGPLTFQQFQDFLPTGEGYARLVELVRLYVGDEYDFDIQPVLRRDQIPPVALGLARTIRLGWSMWLTTRAGERDAEAAVFSAWRHQATVQGCAS
jgi:type VI secretion system protein ImpH